MLKNMASICDAAINLSIICGFAYSKSKGSSRTMDRMINAHLIGKCGLGVYFCAMINAYAMLNIWPTDNESLSDKARFGILNLTSFSPKSSLRKSHRHFVWRG
jgi:hypothetical protein